MDKNIFDVKLSAKEEEYTKVFIWRLRWFAIDLIIKENIFTDQFITTSYLLKLQLHVLII